MGCTGFTIENVIFEMAQKFPRLKPEISAAESLALPMPKSLPRNPFQGSREAELEDISAAIQALAARFANSKMCAQQADWQRRRDQPR
jgi:hypothetical protein